MPGGVGEGVGVGTTGVGVGVTVGVSAARTGVGVATSPVSSSAGGSRVKVGVMAVCAPSVTAASPPEAGACASWMGVSTTSGVSAAGVSGASAEADRACISARQRTIPHIAMRVFSESRGNATWLPCWAGTTPRY